MTAMRWISRVVGSAWRGLGTRGSVSILFASSLVPAIIAMSVAIDFARIADGRASLQRAVDNAALSGAAAYSVNAQAAQTRAVTLATSAFCEMAASMPAGFALSGTAPQSCGGAGVGATVSTQIGGYRAGTPGIAPSQCSATNAVISGVTCGFIVTVSGQATMTTMLPAYLGLSKTITATAMAINPFIDIGKAIKAQINGSARYTNSIWIYPLLLDASGNPDFSTNSGAIPGLTAGYYPLNASPSGCTSLTDCGSIGTPAGVNCTSNAALCGSSPPSGCTDDPLQFTCGVFTMLANTYYNTATNPCLPASPCYPKGAGSYPAIVQGVVQNPAPPPVVITATTPIGIAFVSISGGNTGYGFGGYQSNPANGCYYPGNTIYTTVSQYFGNVANSIIGGNPALDWPKVTRWFYSSYLANGYPPSTGQILSQNQLLTYSPKGGSTVYYNLRVPSIGVGQVSGGFLPKLKDCAANAANGNSYDEFITTSYPSTGATNGSLFILNEAADAPYTPPANTGYAYQRYTPANTPGRQYAAMSCQAYGNRIVTFYWNDMGGNAAFADDLDYNNGTVRIGCSATAGVTLIQ